jgi:hypothetical protein
MPEIYSSMPISSINSLAACQLLEDIEFEQLAFC